MRTLPGGPARVLAAALLPCLILSACDAFDGERSEPPEESSEIALSGRVADGAFDVLGEPAQGGRARSLALLDARWGRRVDLWALDPVSGDERPWLAGIVVAPDLEALGPELERGVSLASGRERLLVRHAQGSAAAARVLDELERGLVPLGAGALPPDAALSLRFSDLVDPVGLGAGVAVTLDGVAVAPARLETDTAHGVALRGVHHSSRVVLELEPSAARAGAALELRLGALAAVAPLAADVGGELLGLGVAPFVVGRLDGQLAQVVAGSPGFYLVEFQFEDLACAFAPQVGDVLQTATHAAQLIAPGGPPQGVSTGRLRVQLVSGDPQTFAPAAAVLRARWDPALGAPAACFVRISPEPGSAPAGGVSTAATVSVEFSEPMLPASVQSTGTWTLERTLAAAPLSQVVPAKVLANAALTTFELVPVLPLSHTQGQAERYRLSMAGGPFGIVDRQSTPLEQALPEFELALEPGQPTQLNDGLVYSFAGLDEDGDGLPDLRGQALFDLAKAQVGGRPVMRFSSVIDESQPMIAAMHPSVGPVMTPLNPLGAKQMSLWRYVDLGFALLDDLFHNVDVEGLHWTPFQAVTSDQFGEFRMALAHSFFMPDEALDAGLLPAYRFTGLVAAFDSNVLDGLTVVHDKAKGYVVNPADTFVSATGTLMQPWPLNRNIPPSQYVHWTWRDTAVLEVGGHNSGVGVDPRRLEQVTGIGELLGFYPPTKIPTIGEPLLMEFRTYPDAGALGTNGLKTSFAINSSYRPTFRAFSAGGVDASGVTHFVDPDNEPVATGGYSPFGQQVGGLDNTVLWGQADFVMRVSRAHTRWLDTGAAHDFVQAVVEHGGAGLPAGTQVQLAYRGATSVTAAAGAPWLDAGLYDPYGDGYTQSQLDMLFGAGMKPAIGVVEFPVDNDKSWHDSIDAIDGARWIQVRLTFVGNAVSNVTPQVAGVAIAFQ
jgi:hypothetical protein